MTRFSAWLGSTLLVGGLSACASLRDASWFVGGNPYRPPHSSVSGSSEEAPAVAAQKQDNFEDQFQDLLSRYEIALKDFEGELQAAQSLHLLKDAELFLIASQEAAQSAEKIKSCATAPSAKTDLRESCAYQKQNLEIARNLIDATRPRLGPGQADKLLKIFRVQYDYCRQLHALVDELARSGVSADFGQRFGLDRLVDHRLARTADLDSAYVEWTMVQQAALESGTMNKRDTLLISQFGFDLVDEILWHKAVANHPHLERKKITSEGRKRADYLEKRGLESFGLPAVATFRGDRDTIYQEQIAAVNPAK